LQLEGKRVLVTGGAGFVGGHLVEHLTQSNQVTILDNFSTAALGPDEAVPDGVKVCRADIRDRSGVDAAIGDAEVIVHLAVVNLRESISDPLKGHLVNDLGTLILLLAARDRGVERFVYVSSSEVYGTAERAPMDESHRLRPTTPYGAGKLAGEALALSFHDTYGVPVVVVRPFNTYGPRAHVSGSSGELIPRLVARALSGRPLEVFGDGLQTRDFTWVGDTVRGIALAAECDELVGDCVNIARGESVTVLAVATLIQDLLGIRLPIEHRPARPGDVRHHHADVAKARKLLGFEAGVSLEAGLARYLEWVRASRPAATTVEAAVNGAA
jgi:UDP-glucose 4-epimerase